MIHRNAAAAQQRWSADSYGRHARFVADLAGEIFAWLAPRPGQRILDLGCGDGALTERIVAAGAEVVGVDASEDMIAAARNRGLDAVVMDGHALIFEQEFDVVFSNAALHWMVRPEEVIAGVRRALRPRGRFVAELGGHGNIASIITAMRAVARMRGGDEALAGPWFFPTSEEYSELLNAAGFTVRRIGLYPRRTPLKTGMVAWLRLFRSPFFAQFGDDADAALAEVEDLLSVSLRDSKGNWTADYCRLRVEAVL